MTRSSGFRTSTTPSAGGITAKPTVQNHLTHVDTKLDLSSRVQSFKKQLATRDHFYGSANHIETHCSVFFTNYLAERAVSEFELGFGGVGNAWVLAVPAALR
jgi:hypothetical protein